MSDLRDYLDRVTCNRSKALLEHVWKSSLLHLENADFSDSFNGYTFLLENCPQVGPFLQNELLLLLKKWGAIVVSEKSEDQLQDLMDAYAMAARYCPTPGLFLGSCAKLFFRLKRYMDARICFEEQKKLEPDNLKLDESLDNLNTILLDRWHFPMLNDSLRNSRYREAIVSRFSRLRATAKENESSVCLDIGAGTGLLSMYAASAAAEFLPPAAGVKVIACELDECMFRTARECLERNQMDGRVRLLHCHSDALESLPGCRDDEKLSTVITEIFDAGLLGEGALESLDHVHRVLKNDENMQVIPRAATIYVCLMESEDIRNYSRYRGGNECLTSDEAMIFCRVGSGDGADDPRWEPYTCERVDPHGRSCGFLSEPVALDRIDFESGETVAAYLDGVKRLLPVIANRSGALDALVLWFDLHLDDEHLITTSPLDPEGRSSCWQQAIYPVFDVDGQRDVTVEKGDLISVECHIKDFIRLRCLGVQRMVANCGSGPPSPGPAPAAYYLPPSAVSLLNDVPYHDKCIMALQRLFPKDGDRSRFGLVVISGSTGASGLIPALWALKAGHSVRFVTLNGGSGSVDNEGCAASDVRMILEGVCLQKGIDLKLLSFDGIEDSSPGESSESEDDDDEDGDEDEASTWGNTGHDPFELDEIDWVAGFFDPIESSGGMTSNVLKDYYRIRKILPRGMSMVPQTICCLGMLVESRALASEGSFLSDDSTRPFLVGEVVNRFKTSFHMNFSLDSVPHVRITEPFELFTFDLNPPRSELEGPKSNLCNRSTEIDQIKPSRAGLLTSLVYWFRMEFGGGVVEEEEEEEDGGVLSAETTRGHWKQSAVNLESLRVETSDLLKLKVVCRSGYFLVGVEKKGGENGEGGRSSE